MKTKSCVCICSAHPKDPLTPQQWHVWMRVRSHADTRPLLWPARVKPAKRQCCKQAREKREVVHLETSRMPTMCLSSRWQESSDLALTHTLPHTHTHTHTHTSSVLEEISWKLAPTGTDRRKKFRPAFISEMCIILYMIKCVKACQMWWFESILGLFLSEQLMPARWWSTNIAVLSYEPYLNMLWKHLAPF